MGKKLDLTGQVFGLLTVIRLDRLGSHGKEYWCKCQCGNEKLYRGSTLTSGTVKGCGCQRNKNRDHPSHLHIPNTKIRAAQGRQEWYKGKAHGKVGEIHWRLTIENVRLSSDCRRYDMECRCECGETTIQCYSDIKIGRVKSCGCHQREMASKSGSSVGYKNAKTNGRWWHDRLDGTTVRMRSGYEVMFAEALDAKAIEWQYEPRLFKLEDGMRYRPDFYLPATDEWVEVKGWYKEKDKEKVRKFHEQGHKIRVVQLAELEESHPLSYRTFLKQRMCPA